MKVSDPKRKHGLGFRVQGYAELMSILAGAATVDVEVLHDPGTLYFWNIALLISKVMQWFLV